jgi:hypothetical protein
VYLLSQLHRKLILKGIVTIPLQNLKLQLLQVLGLLDLIQRFLVVGLVHILMALPRNSSAKRLHIRLTGSRAVTNRYTSEAQSPAPDTGRFEIEWDILEGRERSWGWVSGLSFLCSVVCFVSPLCVAACLCVLFGFITSCSNSLP